MSNIKILTFSQEVSFGAQLQCYALTKVLQGLGHKVELICLPLEKENYGFVGNLSAKINELQFRNFIRKRQAKFIDLHNITINDDVFIVGSDQVWNPDLTKSKAMNFLFDFLPDTVKRFSYAASFGNIEWTHKEITNRVKTCLQKFSAIGVRENSGVQICKDIFNLSAQPNLDPTLLLDNYDELLGCKNHLDKKTLASFFLLPTKEKIDLLKYLGYKLNIKPVALNQKHFYKGIKYCPFVSVENWIRQIHSSNFVVTDSFHCTVFAILFRKQFIVVPSVKKRMDRIQFLLEQLDLTSRFFIDTNIAAKSKIWQKMINYDQIFIKLNILRKTSLEFLIDAIEK